MLPLVVWLAEGLLLPAVDCPALGSTADDEPEPHPASTPAAATIATAPPTSRIMSAMVKDQATGTGTDAEVGGASAGHLQGPFPACASHRLSRQYDG